MRTHRALAPTLLHVFPGFEGGGAQLRMASILNAIGDEFRHQIIAIDGNVDAAGALDPALGAEFHPAPARSGSLPAANAFRRAVRALRPDAVLTYNWGAIDASIGARLAGCTVIHNECGFGADEAVTLKRRRVWTRRIILNTIFRTVVTSANMLRIARTQFRIPAAKAQLIRTGVDVERYRPGRNTEGRLSMGMSASEILFGYAGGLRPEKNLPLMIRALHEARIPNARLLLIGDGPRRGALEELTRQLGVAGQVIFAGHVSDPLPYLLMLDAFVMSSSTEQVSNALLEAMACGLPVVCTDVGDSRELLGPAGERFVVPPGDTGALTQALREVAANGERRVALGVANRERSVAEYGKDKMVREYAALFQAAVEHQRGSVKRQPRTALLGDTTAEISLSPRGMGSSESSRIDEPPCRYPHR